MFGKNRMANRTKDKQENEEANPRQILAKRCVRWIMNGIKLVLPYAVVALLYKVIVGTVQGFVGPISTFLGNFLGIPPLISGFGLVCVLILLATLLGIGAFYDTQIGGRIINTVDALFCRIWGFNKLRGAFKKPARENKNDEDNPDDLVDKLTTGRESVVWCLAGIGWEPLIVRHRQVDPLTGIEWLTILNLSVPIPSGFSVKYLEARFTSPAGVTVSQWQFWRSSGGGEVPAGAIMPPKTDEFLKSRGFSSKQDYLAYLEDHLEEIGFKSLPAYVNFMKERSNAGDDQSLRGFVDFMKKQSNEQGSELSPENVEAKKPQSVSPAVAVII